MSNNIVLNVHLGQPNEKIQATIALLKRFKAFLKSDYRKMVDPISGFGFYLDKKAAKAKLRWLIHVAINRKANIPDVPSRKHEVDYQSMLMRDINKIRNRINHRIVVYQLETDEIRKRYQYLLSDHNDW